MNKWLICCLLAVANLLNVIGAERNVLSLAGEWRFRLDADNVGASEAWYNDNLADRIQLPGSTDEGGYGEPEKTKVRFNALVRPHYYVGKAWYQKDVEIPADWNDKQITLFLERCHWITEVWVNDQKIGSEDSLCAPHEYDLGKWLTPGKHRITICVNNKYPFSLGGFASSVSEHTQSNWNGIVGKIELRSMDLVWIDDMRVFPDVDKKEALVRMIVRNETGNTIKGKVTLQSSLEKGGNVGVNTKGFKISGLNQTIEVIVPMGDEIQLWNEFTPTLYQIDAQLTSKTFADSHTVLFGMREFGVDGKMFTVNGKKVYMRGNLECCVFPLTGYPSMTEKEWIRIMQTMKDHGLNHVRFHSWCPPEAAFSAASRVGMYLQAEAPRANVGNEIPARDEFIQNELLRINKYYGNLPSFMFLTTGNEIKSKQDVNPEMIATAKNDDPRHLYSTTSGGYGMEHAEHTAYVDQFRVGSIRSFFGPSTDKDHGGSLKQQSLPYMSHEVGQWAVFPNMNEIPKYTGVLKPQNLEEVRDDLEAKGMFGQAKDFFDVTAKHSALLYKEEIEVMLRSPGHAGFQLLMFHDYPGQGTSHVGLVDAFWDSKGGITEEEFTEFCAPVVPLLRMGKRTYSNGETFSAEAEILHYGPKDLIKVQPYWSIVSEAGDTVATGVFQDVSILNGQRAELGSIHADLSGVEKAAKLKVTVGVMGTDIHNSWDIWCYPERAVTAIPSDVVVSDRFDQSVSDALQSGQNVLLLPKRDTLGRGRSLPGQFRPVFWSPTWFWTKTRGGDVSMSILCDPTHPVFADFPTERFSNWQWWDLKERSNSIVLDKLPQDFKPTIQVVDHFGRLHRLGNLFEAKVGNGKLMICSIDIETDLDRRLAAKQFRYSLINYLKSTEFDPQQQLTSAQVKALFIP